jgi:hypothetical protein
MTADDGTADDGTAHSSTITGEDIAWLNGRSVARAGAFARLAGTALIVAGALGVVAWLWMSVRRQQQLSEIADFANGLGDGSGDGDVLSFTDQTVSLSERIDVLADTAMLLVTAALAVAAGSGLRLVAEYTVARTGGSVTGFEAGDPVPEGGIADPPSRAVLLDDPAG